jgi:hypothetical protein
LLQVPRNRLRAGFDWMFRSRETGRVVIIQPLNVPLGIYFLAAAVRRFAGLDGAPRTAVEVIAFGSIMWWAVDEVLRGVNPFRRLLGAGVAIATVAGALL